jgi:hypothetical protein
MRLMWSNKKPQRKRRSTCISSQLPRAKGEKAVKKGTEKASKEASGKNRSDKEKASQKTKEGTAMSDATAPDLSAEYKAVYKKSTHAKETAKIQRDAAATKMFQF